MKASCDSRDGSFVPAVVVPTFNNARTLIGVLEGMLGHGRLIVVDDGSTDETRALLEDWRRGEPDVYVERHEVNRGKGAALRTGFQAATALGATHVITIDADGQHDPDDAPAMLEAARRRPEAMIIGVRPMRVPGYPWRCRLGRRVSGLLVFLETLHWLRDTQCGLRVYPLDVVEAFGRRGERFGYETEVVVRSAWGGGSFVEQPVSCVYEVPEGRVSHWRPVVDSLRDAVLHGRLLARSFVPLPHPRLAADEPRTIRRSARRFAAWISPLALWRSLRDAAPGDARVAASAAVGAFVGCSPFYGLHAWLSLFLAWRLRLLPLPAVLGSMVSTPPAGVVIAAVSMQVGHLLLTGALLEPAAIDASRPWQELTVLAIGSWLLGGAVVGAVVAGAVFVVTHGAARVVRRGPDAEARRAEQGEDLVASTRTG